MCVYVCVSFFFGLRVGGGDRLSNSKFVSIYVFFFCVKGERELYIYLYLYIDILQVPPPQIFGDRVCTPHEPEGRECQLTVWGGGPTIVFFFGVGPT